ncbi:MAG: Nif3-like dinuclear metal center hexameric protein [Paludibacter sp.]|nr:Nif3-like dinuclear metal center hexameric protein [Bacteroidales bacterium]MCM1068561.1 Nif3-like dinuclear metal center hexameric protein [Prevotella sp.]MCM1353225.1 Nif3-like dinuclear metal center hexameric protein [Bacteroides sp.]MCM1442367.1 Nif3-like dinuclear metal center hexameric protein [Muribaculum sp.]MCM1481186.1 Nif3-like dinuclear metal center hexameric protein [Paludibacter sp.]
MKVQEIIDIIESVAPLSIQQEWDNSGLQVGNREAEVSSVLLCTDVTEAVLQEAEREGYDMIVSHHPLFFHGLKTLQGNTSQERCVISAVRNGIAIYSAHTSMDSWLHGVSGRMAEKLDIRDYVVLVPTGIEVGFGVVGDLPEAMDFEAFLALVKQTFSASMVRYTVSPKQAVQRIAFCGGAGSEFLPDAVAAKADVYLSADFKYHEFQQADERIAIVDIGHFESEQFTKEIFRDLLSATTVGLRIAYADADRSPILVY